jgi:hypothetical protein
MFIASCWRIALAMSLLPFIAVNAPASDSFDYLTPSPTGNAIHAAWSPDGGATTWFVGDGGLILQRSASGTTIVPSGTLAPLRAVHGTGPDDIWAVGGSALAETPEEKSVILHFDGSAWVRRGILAAGLPATLNTSYEVRDVYAAGSQPGDVWAVGAGGLPWRWQGGTSWTTEQVAIDYARFPNARYGELVALFGFSGQDVFAVGSFGTVLRRDASGWSLMRQFETEQPGYTGSSTSFNLLQDVWGPDTNHVFACGNSGQVYLLDRSRVVPEWRQVNDGGFIFSAYDLSAMAGTGPDDVWFVGAGGVLRRWYGAGTPEGLQVFDAVTGDNKMRAVILPTDAGDYLVAGQAGLLERLDPSLPRLMPLHTPARTTSLLRHAGWTDRLWLAPEITDAASGVFTWDQGEMKTHPVAGLAEGPVTVFETFADDDIWLATTNLPYSSIMRYDGSNWSPGQIPGNYGWPIVGMARTGTGSYAILRGANWADGIDGYGGHPCHVGSNALGCLDPSLTRENFYLDMASDDTGAVWAVGASVEETASGSGVWRVTGGRVVSGRNDTWATPVALGQDVLNAVAAGAGHVVAVGENRTAVHSRNGGPWLPVAGITRRPPVNDQPLETFVNVVHAGNGVFYAVSNTGSGWTDGSKGFLWRIENGRGTLIGGGYSSRLYALAADPVQDATFVGGSAGAVLTDLLDFVEPAVRRRGPQPLLPVILLLLEE